MDREFKDREWQLLQYRIDQRFRQYFINNVKKLEYKQENVVHLLEMPRGDRAEYLEPA